MFQNIPADKVLEIVKQGPTIPAKVAKLVGGDTMIIGAVLSTLISQGNVRVSTLKIGGSPLYFIPGDEEKLEQFVDHLNPKDRVTFNKLKDKKVLKDSDQDPLTRVSLRAIKDFAKAFDAEQDGQKELFWRYHLFSSDEALTLGRNILKASRPVVTESNVQTPDVPSEQILEESNASAPTHEPHALHETHNVKKEHVRKETSSEKTRNITTVDFFEIVKKHITSKSLDIVGKEKIKKSEYSLVLKNHDNNEYIYCKAKDKKSINEGDLASAFVFAQNKKMPCLFITTGSLTKKAETIINKEFPGLMFERIE